MSTGSPTCRQSAFKRHHSDKHFSEFLPARWRRKSTGIDMEQNYVTVNLCIFYGVQNTIAWLRRRTFTVTGWRTQKIVLWGRARRVWDADDTSPDLGGQNVLKTSEMAIRHNRRTARTELEFSVAGFIFTNVRKYFSGPLTGRNCPPPYMDRPLERERSLFTMSEHNKYTYKLDSVGCQKGITITAGHLYVHWFTGGWSPDKAGPPTVGFSNVHPVPPRLPISCRRPW